MSDKIDTSDQAIALACMIVTNPGGIRKGDGWQKHVNDLIRALREERNTLQSRLATVERETVGWRLVTDTEPAIGAVVLCTDGQRRWMDKRMKDMPMDCYLEYKRHVATHWHQIADLSALAPPVTTKESGG